MKTYLTFFRIIFFFAAFNLTTLGGVFVIQHWSGGKLMLGAGLLLAAIAFIGTENPQKILLNLFRILLVVTAVSALFYGTVAFFQNWQFATPLLSVGIPLSAMLLFDALVTKRVFGNKA